MKYYCNIYDCKILQSTQYDVNKDPVLLCLVYKLLQMCHTLMKLISAVDMV